MQKKATRLIQPFNKYVWTCKNLWLIENKLEFYNFIIKTCMETLIVTMELNWTVHICDFSQAIHADRGCERRQYENNLLGPQLFLVWSGLNIISRDFNVIIITEIIKRMISLVGRKEENDYDDLRNIKSFIFRVFHMGECYSSKEERGKNKPTILSFICYH